LGVGGWGEGGGGLLHSAPLAGLLNNQS
jgi:hypothetical protein